MITITPKAQQHLEKNPDRKKYLRLAIAGEGCGGNQYTLQFTDKQHADEEQEHQGTINLLISKHDKKKLEGTTIDYIKEGTLEGYHITNANQEKKSCHGCSCGH
ncbi:MAG TPA: iron-sulfur cluster assembly accessory protein [Candidatus Nanoarchaeia archaeon]|nr:iron-sulfur cluster assembly accessory protein [Candidatus Nanoarchaeia archaeon]